MSYEYEIVTIVGGLIVHRIHDDAWIPIDESNSDYQQYLVDTDGGLPLPKESK